MEPLQNIEISVNVRPHVSQDWNRISTLAVWWGLSAFPQFPSEYRWVPQRSPVISPSCKVLTIVLCSKCVLPTDNSSFCSLQNIELFYHWPLSPRPPSLFMTVEASVWLPESKTKLCVLQLEILMLQVRAMNPMNNALTPHFLLVICNGTSIQRGTAFTQKRPPMWQFPPPMLLLPPPALWQHDLVNAI